MPYPHTHTQARIIAKDREVFYNSVIQPDNIKMDNMLGFTFTGITENNSVLDCAMRKTKKGWISSTLNSSNQAESFLGNNEYVSYESLEILKEWLEHDFPQRLNITGFCVLDDNYQPKMQPPRPPCMSSDEEEQTHDANAIEFSSSLSVTHPTDEGSRLISCDAVLKWNS